MDFNFVLPATLTPLTTTVLVIILAASGVMSGLSGFGFSAIGAISLSLLPPTLAIPLLMTLSTANQMLSIGQLKADMKPLKEWWPNGAAPYMLGGVVGVPLGLWLLQVLPVTALMIVFGIFLVAYSAYSIYKPDYLCIKTSNDWRISALVGAVGGLIGGFTAFPGAAVVIWTGLARMSKTDTRAIVQPYILGMQIFSLVTLAIFKPASFSGEFWTLTLLAMPVVLTCTMLGLRLYRMLSDFNFRRIAFVLLGSSGMGILIKGVHVFS